MAESRALRQQLQRLGGMLEMDGCQILGHAVQGNHATLDYSNPGDPMIWTVTVTPWREEAPAIEWGVRFGTGASRSEVGCPDEAEARAGAAEIRAEKPGWNAVAVWRTAARPAGPWNEEAGQ